MRKGELRKLQRGPRSAIRTTQTKESNLKNWPATVGNEGGHREGKGDKRDAA